MSRKIKTTLIIIFSLLTAVLLYFLLKGFNFSLFLSSIKNLSALHLIVLSALQIFTQLLLNYQWFEITKISGGKIKFLSMLNINSHGTVAEAITPGVKIGGEVIRAVLLKKEGIETADAAAIVAVQKMISLSAFFVLIIGALIYFIIFYNIFNIYLNIVVIIVLSAFIVLFISILFYPQRFNKFASNAKPKSKFKAVLQSFFKSVIDKSSELKNRGMGLQKQMLISFIIWFLFPLKLILLANFLNIQADLIYLCAVTFICYIVSMLPLLPGGLGSFEASMTALFVVIGTAVEQAAAAAFIFRFFTFWLVVLLSVTYSLLYKVLRRKKI